MCDKDESITSIFTVEFCVMTFQFWIVVIYINAGDDEIVDFHSRNDRLYDIED